VTVIRIQVSKLFLRYRLLLSLAQMTVIAGLIVFCMMDAPQGRTQSQTGVVPQFEVASIKPSNLIAAGDNNSESIDLSPGGRLTLSNIRLSSCLKWASLLSGENMIDVCN
jgi:hypothetical protein